MIVLYELERDAELNRTKAIDALERLLSITFYISERYMEIDTGDSIYPENEDTPVSEDVSKIIAFGNFYDIINKCLIELDLNSLIDKKPEEEVIDEVLKNIKAPEDLVTITREQGLVEFSLLIITAISYIINKMKIHLESSDPYLMDAALLNYRFGTHGLISSDALIIKDVITSYIKNAEDVNNLTKDINDLFDEISIKIVNVMKDEEGLDY